MIANKTNKLNLFCLSDNILAEYTDIRCIFGQDNISICERGNTFLKMINTKYLSFDPIHATAELKWKSEKKIMAH